jgi:hypothetical protein
VNYPNIRHYGEFQFPLVMFRLIIRATAQPRNRVTAYSHRRVTAHSRNRVMAMTAYL